MPATAAAGTGATLTAAAGTGAADTPPARKSNPNLNQRPPQVLFCLKLYNSCPRYSCGIYCNVVVKLVQEYHCFFIHFTSVLQKQFATNDMFLGEVNSYSEHSR